MFAHRFWRRLIILASGLFLGSLVLGGILMSSTALTHAATQTMAMTVAGECSDATLKGTYVWPQEGYQITRSNRVPTALAGIERYDGSGQASGVDSSSTDGQITHSVHFTSSYTVNSDCTVTETQTDETGTISHFDEFVTPDGNRLAFVQTDPGTVVSGVLVRGTGK